MPKLRIRITLALIGWGTPAFATDSVNKIIAVQQAKIQDQSKSLKVLHNEFNDLKAD